MGKLIRQLLLLSGLMSFCGISKSQFNFHINQIPVEKNGRPLSFPWAGGLNSIQYNDLDLNGDGQADLVLFDRSANKLSTFIWKDESYSYAPGYEAFFPKDLISWILLRDYDCDGLNDIFTDSQQGMRVFRNSGSNPPTWELIADPVLTLGSRIINLFFNPSDIANIDDLDGDGDLDVLAFNFATGENIDFHQNMSVENTGSCGLDFVRITRNYGGISECDCSDFSFDQPCPVNGRILHTGGKAILAIDLDNDGDKDLLTAEEGCEELSLLPNVGNASNPSFNESRNFFTETTTSHPILFSAAYFIDLDGDAIKDLAISTNSRENDHNNVDFTHSSFFYKNTGSTDLPQFNLTSTDLLQEDMIEVGENAHPAFADYDRDGDLDLFIGNRGRLIDGAYVSTIHLYKNTGSPETPSFTLETADYLSLSSLSLIDIKPQFIDINNDGRQDLVFTATSSGTSTTRLYSLENKSGLMFQFDINSFDILFEHQLLREHPYLYDMDSDGNFDLIVGRSIGRLEYYRNSGTNQSPDFQLADEDFLSISTSVERIELVPVVVDLNRDGDLDLITTDASGELTIYEDIMSNSVEPVRALVKNPMVPDLQKTDFGRISWPAIGDLYHNGSMDIAIGTIAGGVYLLSDTTAITRRDNRSVLKIFPNPSSGQAAFIQTNLPGTIQIFNISGKLIVPDTSVEIDQTFVMETGVYEPGIYIVRFTSISGKTSSNRLIISD